MAAASNSGRAEAGDDEEASEGQKPDVASRLITFVSHTLVEGYLAAVERRYVVIGTRDCRRRVLRVAFTMSFRVLTA